MNNHVTAMKKKTTLLIFPLFLLSACAPVPIVPYTADELKDRVFVDREQMYANQEPVTGPISFEEAAARALKYNLDYRLKLMEQALAKNLYDVSQHEMLPRLVVSAGFAQRNNDSGGTSVGIDDGQVSLRPSTSQERYRDLRNLGFSWSLLDFGVSYARARQKGDQILMAEERRRKVMQNVLQDVRNAYWRALGAQRLIGEVDALLVRVNKALVSARIAEDKNLLPLQQALAYQRALLDAVSILTLRRQDLELARSELAALMSLPPGTPFVLADGAEPALPAAPASIEVLERLALERRPEIMEEWYRKRVTEADIKVAKMQLWPNIGLDVNAQYDSNQYLYNNNWIDTGFRVSLNLLKLLQMPALDEAQASQNKTDDLRRMALSMAVLTQVRVGTLRYNLALSDLQFANQSLRVDGRLLEYAKAAAKVSADSELEVVRAEARWLLARYQRYIAYSHAQSSWGQLYNSVGLEVLPDAVASHDVKALAVEIRQTMAQWEKTAFQTSKVAVDAKPAN